MRRLLTCLVATVLATSAALVAVPSVASALPPPGSVVVDTTGAVSDPPLCPFGHPDTSTYGQVVTAPAGQATLDSFGFLMDLNAAATFRIFVYAWDGTKATGPQLYASGPMHTSGTGMELITASSMVVHVVPGNQYVVFGSIDADYAANSGIPTGCWGWAHDSNTYTGGELQFLNDGGDSSQWTSGAWNSFQSGDMGFHAQFLPSARTVTIGTGPGASAGCAGVISYTGLPFFGPGVPTGGNIGSILAGSVSVTYDPSVGGFLGPEATTIDGIVATDTRGLAAPWTPIPGNSSIKFSIKKAATPTSYKGSARLTTKPAFSGTPTGQVDAGDLKLPNPTGQTVSAVIPFTDPVTGPNIAVITFGHAGISAPGTVAAGSVAFTSASPNNCNPVYERCVILAALAGPCPET